MWGPRTSDPEWESFKWFFKVALIILGIIIMLFSPPSAKRQKQKEEKQKQYERQKQFNDMFDSVTDSVK